MRRDCWFVPWLRWGLTSAGMEDGCPSTVIPPSVSEDVKHTDRQERERISLHHSSDSLCLQWWPVLNFLLMCVCVCSVREDACLSKSMNVVSVFCRFTCADVCETVCIYVCTWHVLHNPVTSVTKLLFLMICEWDHGTTKKEQFTWEHAAVIFTQSAQGRSLNPECP